MIRATQMTLGKVYCNFLLDLLTEMTFWRYLLSALMNLINLQNLFSLDH